MDVLHRRLFPLDLRIGVTDPVSICLFLFQQKPGILFVLGDQDGKYKNHRNDRYNDLDNPSLHHSRTDGTDLFA